MSNSPRNLCPTCGSTLHAPKPRRKRVIACEGGCGTTWLGGGRGRPRRWCERCYPKHRKRLRNGYGWPAEPLGRSRLLTVNELRQFELPGAA
jgi:hypothetical protein